MANRTMNQACDRPVADPVSKLVLILCARVAADTDRCFTSRRFSYLAHIAGIDVDVFEDHIEQLKQAGHIGETGEGQYVVFPR